MNPADIAFTVLFWINVVMVAFVTVSFIPQFLFYAFFFLKRRHWKPAQTKRRFAILVCAHNEADVIGKTVSHLVNSMNYPKDLYKVYVVCHNCRDDTAKIARENGAEVFEYFDDDPRHGMVAYPMRYGMRRLLAENKEAEIFVRVDADNILHPDYLSHINDSIEAGAHIVRGYEASSNLKQNIWTEQSGIFYFKDSRVQNTFRQALNSTAMSTSPGLSFTRDVAERMDGWDCMTAAEDSEFGFRRLYDGYKIYFNTDAIVYEDQPSSLRDTFKRLTRLGHSMNKLFFTDGWRMVVMFLKTGKPMYLDLLLQIAFNPVSVICFVWFPLYYIAYAICMLLQLSGIHVFTQGYFSAVGIVLSESVAGMGGDILSLFGVQAMVDLASMAIRVILSLYLFCVFQSFIAVYLDRRKAGLDDRLTGMWKGILLSPLFSFIYGICNCVGAVTKLNWKVAARNPSEQKIVLPLPERHDRKIWPMTISEREKKRYAKKVAKTLAAEKKKREKEEKRK